MKRMIEYIIEQKNDGQTILEFLKEKEYSHSVIVHLKRTPEGIRKNGIWSYVSDFIKTGDILSIKLDETENSTGIKPVPLPFPVIYEDEDIIIVNKPAGMPIHPSMNNYENTLANAAMFYFQSRQKPFVYRCINRLDRDTSGLTILAKNMLSGAVLARNSGLRSIRREYTAIVSGITPESGIIDAPIARKEGSCIERCIDFEKGERAVTHYRRIACSTEKNLSLLALRLETGRTHQIRVHMKYAGWPLIGDFLYNPDYRYIKRQALHSSRLSFTHPITGMPLQFYAPLPDDMKII